MLQSYSEKQSLFCDAWMEYSDNFDHCPLLENRLTKAFTFYIEQFYEINYAHFPSDLRMILLCLFWADAFWWHEKLNSVIKM